MNSYDKLGVLLDKVRQERPLVHHLTNYVSANDSANIVLAIGGSPLMADSIDEMNEIVPKVNSLVVNLGTLNIERAKVIDKACKIAYENKIPIILDPVGVGGAKLRQQTAAKIIDKVTVVRGNVSEIKCLMGIQANQRGVDADPKDDIDLLVAKEYSKALNLVLAVSGETDMVIYGNQAYKISNGSHYLTKITGSGCMVTSLIGTFCAVSDDHISSSLLGILIMGVAGELNHHVGETKGMGSFKVSLFDTISKFDRTLLKEGNVVYE